MDAVGGVAVAVVEVDGGRVVEVDRAASGLPAALAITLWIAAESVESPVVSGS